ncbi:MAG: peptidylprolyl isomerase [Rubricoccaceae bacterium]|nr:peptidylprolyl isomerase [Rubricoccaceae bacterium]
MTVAKTGDTVRIHYTGRLSDGTVFDSSDGREPLSFELGAGQVIAGFDSGVNGMKPGQKKTIEIPAAEAYGERDASAVVEVALSEFPEGVTPEVGLPLQLGMEDGGTLQVIVSNVSDETATLDANHPLAGRDLIFDVEVVGID